jgi:hypothetical protein
MTLPHPVVFLLDIDNTLLTTVKKARRSRVTTVFPRQGHYARDPENGETYPPADIMIEAIGDLLQHDLPGGLAVDTGDVGAWEKSPV